MRGAIAICVNLRIVWSRAVSKMRAGIDPRGKTSVHLDDREKVPAFSVRPEAGQWKRIQFCFAI